MEKYPYRKEIFPKKFKHGLIRKLAEINLQECKNTHYVVQPISTLVTPAIYRNCACRYLFIFQGLPERRLPPGAEPHRPRVQAGVEGVDRQPRLPLLPPAALRRAEGDRPPVRLRGRQRGGGPAGQGRLQEDLARRAAAHHSDQV